MGSWVCGKSLRWGSVCLAAALSWSPVAAAHGRLTTLHNFCTLGGCSDGKAPGQLSMDLSGNVFGVTEDGGPQRGKGTVFELVHGRTYKGLYGFCRRHNCDDGAFPQGRLIVDTSGNLYGTTGGGGTHKSGVAFKLSQSGGRWRTYTKLYDFCSLGGNNCPDGSGPSGGLTYAGAESGVLYDGVSPLYGCDIGRRLEFQLERRRCRLSADPRRGGRAMVANCPLQILQTRRKRMSPMACTHTVLC